MESQKELKKFGAIRDSHMTKEILEFLPIEDSFETISKFRKFMDALKKTNPETVNLIVDLKYILEPFEFEMDDVVSKIQNEWRVHFFKTDDVEALKFLARLLKKNSKTL